MKNFACSWFFTLFEMRAIMRIVPRFFLEKVPQPDSCNFGAIILLLVKYWIQVLTSDRISLIWEKNFIGKGTLQINLTEYYRIVLFVTAFLHCFRAEFLNFPVVVLGKKWPDPGNCFIGGSGSPTPKSARVWRNFFDLWSTLRFVRILFFLKNKWLHYRSDIVYSMILCSVHVFVCHRRTSQPALAQH